MDARAYFELADSIADATTFATLATVRERVSRTEMHPIERLALENAMRAREDALRFRARLRGDDADAGGPPPQGD
jgi:hypothetical protein